MKKSILAAIAVISLSACNDEDNRKVVQIESPKGQIINFMPINERDVTDVTVTIAWPMNWAYDAEKNPAVPYIAAEAILSGGTNTHSPSQILELFNDNNSRGKLYVRADHAIGELSFPIEHKDEIVAIAAEMLSSPTYDEKWLDRIKQGTLAGQESARTQTANRMWQAGRAAVLGETPLNDFLSLPDLIDISAVDTAQARKWHKQTITQSGATISVTGALSGKDAGNVVDQLLERLPKSEGAEPSESVANYNPRRILLHLPDAEKSTLGFIGQLPPTAKSGDLVDLLAVHQFGRSPDGPLFQAVRTEMRASYGLQVAISNYDRDNRILIIGGEVDTDKLAEASELVLDTYENFRTEPDLSGFDQMQKSIAEATSKNVSYVDVSARTILELALDNRDVDEAPVLGDLLGKVTKEDVEARLSSAFPSSSNLIVLAAGPNPNALPGACVVASIEEVFKCP